MSSISAHTKQTQQIITAPNVIAAIAIICILTASLVATIAYWPQPNGHLHAVVHDGDGTSHVISLESDSETTIQTSLGTNVVRVSGGTVVMASADCAGGNCLHQSAISQPGQQIICLPHELWVEVTSSDVPEQNMDSEAVNNQGKTGEADAIAR